MLSGPRLKDFKTWSAGSLMFLLYACVCEGVPGTSVPPSVVCCKIEAEYFTASTAALAQTYTRPILNEKSDISGSDEMVDACKMAIRALGGLRARKRMKP